MIDEIKEYWEDSVEEDIAGNADHLSTEITNEVSSLFMVATTVLKKP